MLLADKHRTESKISGGLVNAVCIHTGEVYFQHQYIVSTDMCLHALTTGENMKDEHEYSAESIAKITSMYYKNIQISSITNATEIQSEVSPTFTDALFTCITVDTLALPMCL